MIDSIACSSWIATLWHTADSQRTLVQSKILTAGQDQSSQPLSQWEREVSPIYPKYTDKQRWLICRKVQQDTLPVTSQQRTEVRSFWQKMCLSRSKCKLLYPVRNDHQQTRSVKPLISPQSLCWSDLRYSAAQELDLTQQCPFRSEKDITGLNYKNRSVAWRCRRSWALRFRRRWTGRALGMIRDL